MTKHAVNVRDENKAALAVLLIRLRMSVEDIEGAHEAHCRFIRNGISPHAAQVIKEREMDIEYLENLEGLHSSLSVLLRDFVIKYTLILNQRSP